MLLILNSGPFGSHHTQLQHFNLKRGNLLMCVYCQSWHIHSGNHSRHQGRHYHNQQQKIRKSPGATRALQTESDHRISQKHDKLLASIHKKDHVIRQSCAEITIQETSYKGLPLLFFNIRIISFTCDNLLLSLATAVSWRHLSSRNYTISR